MKGNDYMKNPLNKHPSFWYSWWCKTFLHLSLFFLGMLILLGLYAYFEMCNAGYKIPPYTNGKLSEEYTQTPVFTYKFQKYIERTAEYVQYREDGFETSTTDSNQLGVSDTTAIHDASVYNDEDLKMFHYYNDKINSPTNFIYLVKNKTTGKEYYSEDYFNSTEEVSPSRFQSEIEQQKVFFVLDTETKKYATNLNTDNYLKNTDIDWIIQCITGNLSKTETKSKFIADNSKEIPWLNITDNLTEFKIPQYPVNSYIIYASVDSSFARTQDDFYTTAHSYSFYQKYFALLPLTILLFVLIFALTIAVSGHYKEKSDVIVLNRFDRLWTEFAAIGVMVLSLLWLIFLDRGVPYSLRGFIHSFGLPMYIQIGLVYLLLYPLPAIGFYSLIRRIKAGTLWSGSFLCVACDFCKTYIKHKKITYKVTLLFSLYTLANGITFFLYWRYKRNFYLCLFLLVVAVTLILALYLLIKAASDLSSIMDNTKEIANGNLNHKIPTEHLFLPFYTMANDINNISSGLSAAVEEQIKSERLKTELITNVSHDIKTPLTSIINYVDLLKKENLQNKVATEYLDVLTQKSWRLKILIEDLVEASKASTGSLSLNLEKLNLVELIRQSAGEFEDRFLSRQLELVLNISEEPIYILADGRSTFRIIENVFSNAYKYALKDTRIYVDVLKSDTTVTVTIKNISAEKLNISSEELMERFVRGNRARNTEGSGLGLSIAKSLAFLQKGDFNIHLDGDLFKATITFNVI